MTMNVKIEFGSRVRNIRNSKGFTQEELAFRAGLHRTYISMVERGERNVSLVNIIKIANALEIEVALLFKK